jgi:hypothetical protein
VNSIWPLLALDKIVCEELPRLKVQAPVCEILTFCPPTSNSVERAAPALPATLKLTVPDPEPEVGETNVIQAFAPTQASEDAILQLQVGDVEIEKEPNLAAEV